MLRYILDPGEQLPPSSQVGAPDSNTLHQEQQAQNDPQAILDALKQTTIGQEEQIQTPFGPRRTVYSDYTASGRASRVVENFVQSKVLPRYGNTHTLTSATARQTTYFRAEAREIVRHHLNATHEDAVIFAGNGSTGAAHLLVQTMQRSGFNLGAAATAPSESSELRDMHYREDRWGGGECTLCGVRVKSANIYQAHRHSEAHRAKLRASAAAPSGGGEGAGTGSSPGAANLPKRRRVVVLLDTVLHHSSSLPFRELLSQHPILGGSSSSSSSSLADFEGVQYRTVASEDIQSERPEQDGKHCLVEVEVASIPCDFKTGLMDETALEARLAAIRTYRSSNPDLDVAVLCIFAAASNVTGLASDVPRVTALTKRSCSEAVVCWDFAAALGHIPCDMNPAGDVNAAIDAAFFSPHKLWGGPGSTGVLAVKKRILCNAVPAVPGGGVVFYVTEDTHSYIQNSEEREEAGTPNILGCIRTGLVFHILDQIPPGAVAAAEGRMLKKVLSAWEGHSKIEILGPSSSTSSSSSSSSPGPGRTGIISFMIRYGNSKPGLYLHYNYVVALLNDLFGVQARGGCACAGPYAQWLLGMDAPMSTEMETKLAQTAQEVLRPGFARVGVHWAMSEEEVEILISSVRWIADHGWKLLAAYTFDRETGEWLHRLDVPGRKRDWISNLRLTPGALLAEGPSAPISELEEKVGLKPQAGTTSSTGSKAAPRTSEQLLAAAEQALKEAYSSAQVALSQSKWPILRPETANLLWFALPADVAFTLRSTVPDRPQLAPSASQIFADDSLTRPEHSILNARLGTEAGEGGNQEAPESNYEAWEPLDGMQPEEDEEDEAANGTAAAAAGPKFTANQLRPSIPKSLRGMVGKAISDFKMVEEGDRLLVGLSGGKDSLTVLHILLALRRSAPINFEIAAATVDPETPEFNPHPLVPYLEALGVKYHMLSKPIIEMAKVHMDPKRPSLCAFCSRMKRGLLYSCMREQNYNVLVLGQHLDDFAESFFMSAIHNGLLRTMKANYWVQQEDVRVCRPLIYVRENQAAVFAKENQLPIIADNCPACFAAPKERHKTKVLLSSLEFDYPQLFSTLLRTMRPLYSLETADRGNGVLAGFDDDDDVGPAAGAGGGGGKKARNGGANGKSAKGNRAAAPKGGRDVADEDADAELILSACGPSACSTGLCGLEPPPPEENEGNEAEVAGSPADDDEEEGRSTAWGPVKNRVSTRFSIPSLFMLAVCSAGCVVLIRQFRR